jgi:uncharacterized protein YkwD
MMLLALLIAASLDPTIGPPPPSELMQLRAELVAQLNEHRAQAGLTPFGVDPIAEQAAEFQAVDMMNTGKMRHEDSSGRSPFARYEAFGGKADYYGENIGFRSPGVVDPVLLWQVLAKLDARMMAEVPPDDGHRRNILSSHYTAVGIGVAVGPDGVFLAEDFSSIKEPSTGTSSSSP